jgi:hypothetical protein
MVLRALCGEILRLPSAANGATSKAVASHFTPKEGLALLGQDLRTEIRNTMDAILPKSGDRNPTC